MAPRTPFTKTSDMSKGSANGIQGARHMYTLIRINYQEERPRREVAHASPGSVPHSHSLKDHKLKFYSIHALHTLPLLFLSFFSFSPRNQLQIPFEVGIK
ncbi:hypothetical protein NE237_004975 [Protea cynaroides]|uniref:Uncharacterized protein n=1 Tax=Protea cynaroides TaxID=273540 RepID=A0A9Q0KJY3_9MAGN|nr:hypothetical protein NE237_004975 [Protea cynaroides]